MRKRILASILTVIMLLSLLPTTVFAAQTDNTNSQGIGTEDDPWDISAENDGSVTAYLTSNSEIKATYGDKITLPVSASGYTLHIEGTGAIAPEKRYEEYGGKKAEITRIEVGSGITSIGTGAFWNCTAASEIVFDSGSQLKEIGKNAFHSNTALKEIVLPESVTTIGDAAFYACSMLESVTFMNPDNMEAIGGSAFAACTSLKYLNNPEKSSDYEWMPKNLTAIGKAVFNGDSSLVGKVTIPAEVENLGDRVFCNATSITSVTFENGSKLKSIGVNVFENMTIKSLNLPDSLESIGDNAFRGMTNLKTITIPANVSSIGSALFYNCSSLESVIFESGSKVSSLPRLYGSQKSMILPDSLETIQESALSYTSIEFLQIPFTVKNIANNAFKGSSELHSLDMTALSDTVSIVNAAAFSELGSIPTANPRITNVIYLNSSTLISTINVSNTFRSAFAITNGGTFADNTEFEAGKLAEPTREGYKFDGWYTQDGTNTGEWGTTIEEVSAKSVYYAKWTMTDGDDENIATTAREDEVTELPAEVQEDMTSEPALADADNEETAKTEPAEVPEQPTESDPADIAEKEPAEDTTIPEEENDAEVSTEEPVNSVEGDTMTLQDVLTFNDPGDTTYYFYAKETNTTLGQVTSSSSDAVLNYNTTLKGLRIGDNTVEVYAGEKTDESEPAGTIKVTLNKKALTVSGLKAVDRTANGSADVTLTGGSLVGVENGDTVGFTASGTMSNNAAGDNKPVTVAVKLTGTDAKWYTVTPPTNVTVNISSSSGSHSSGGSSSSTTYPVNVESAKNGAVKSDRTSASKGATVTLTVTPKDGYELDGLTVTDKDGKTVKVTEGKNGKYTFTMPASKVTVESTFTKIEEQSGVTFRDVPASAYYYDAVEWAVEKGVTSGTSATTFSPDAACTRAQAVTFLWRAAGSPAPKSSVNPFTDVLPGAYYYDAVLWAVEQGITTGTSATTFSPDATCTRGQIVTFLYRADGTAINGSNPFTDVADSAYYAAPVKWAVAEGVTSGTSATTFSPDASCTRAQIVTFLYRAYAD